MFLLHEFRIQMNNDNFYTITNENLNKKEQNKNEIIYKMKILNNIYLQNPTHDV